eukprot:6875890-Alexandrium_andersonii.AAC.1
MRRGAGPEAGSKRSDLLKAGSGDCAPAVMREPRRKARHAAQRAPCPHGAGAIRLHELVQLARIKQAARGLSWGARRAPVQPRERR